MTTSTDRIERQIHIARRDSQEPPTLVVFELSDEPGGTLLRIVESGFDAVRRERRLEAFRMNSGGWDAQLRNIANHVGA